MKYTSVEGWSIEYPDTMAIQVDDWNRVVLEDSNKRIQIVPTSLSFEEIIEASNILYYSGDPIYDRYSEINGHRCDTIGAYIEDKLNCAICLEGTKHNFSILVEYYSGDLDTERNYVREIIATIEG